METFQCLNTLSCAGSAVLAVRDWYAANGMLLNAEKSSAILVSHHRKFLTANTCLVAGTIVPIKNRLTALGAMLDSRLSGTAFVTSKVQSCTLLVTVRLQLPLAGASTFASCAWSQIMSNRCQGNWFVQIGLL